MNRKALIESVAKATVRQARADPLLLPEFIARLDAWHDGAGNLGTPGELVVRGKGDASRSPRDVLMAMRSEPEFSGRFGAVGESFYTVRDTEEPVLDDYESETKQLIAKRLAERAPDGNVLRLSPMTKVQIEEEVRQERNAPKARQRRAHKPKAPSITPHTSDYRPGDGLRCLQVERAAHDDARSREKEARARLSGVDPTHSLRAQLIERERAKVVPPNTRPKSFVELAKAEREARGY